MASTATRLFSSIHLPPPPISSHRRLRLPIRATSSPNSSSPTPLDADLTTTATSTSSPTPAPPKPALSVRSRSRSKRALQRQQKQKQRREEKSSPARKSWEKMSLGEKAAELYMGEKGLLFWLNKFAYASIFIIIGGWILFRFVGPALNLYQLDTPPLSPGALLKSK